MTTSSHKSANHIDQPESLEPRAGLVRLIGFVLLSLGLAAAAMGPVEVYPLYLIAEGGRFHYDGFQISSFMFGNITVQIAGYYVAASILIPLGYGHIRLRNWVRRLVLACTWCWVVLGLPLGLILLFTLFSVKSLPTATGIGITIGVAISYAVLPWLIIRLYSGRVFTHRFRRECRSNSWLNSAPLPIVILVVLFMLFAVFLHIPLLFSGLFPFFGSWLSRIQGMEAIDAFLMTLLVLTWATASRHRWAWWADLLYFVLLAATSVTTLAQTTLAELLAVAGFPPYEVQILQNMPVRSSHMAAFIGTPLIGTIIAILASRSSFNSSPDAQT